MQVRLWAISKLSGEGISRSEAAKARWAATARRPDSHVTQAVLARRQQQARDSSGPVACKKAQVLHGLAAKPATDFNPDGNQMAASGVAKLLCRLWRAALVTAQPGWTSARGCASP